MSVIMAFMESMGTSSIPIIAAFFIGLMTAISPCPLATNITAIAYASKHIENKRKTLLIGIFYTLGRVFTYVLIASLIVWFGLNTQVIALGLQKYGQRLLGPLLLIIGVVLSGLVSMPEFVKRKKHHTEHSKSRLERVKEYLSTKGILGSFLLGIIFALAFCPFSAVLFFGMLIPLAVAAGDGIIIPAVFAIATGLPVIILSIVLVYSVSKLGSIMHKIQLFEKWARVIVAIIFFVVGIYYTLNYTFGWI
jgi:cytochrome c-type biogenesis protein